MNFLITWEKWHPFYFKNHKIVFYYNSNLKKKTLDEPFHHHFRCQRGYICIGFLFLLSWGHLCAQLASQMVACGALNAWKRQKKIRCPTSPFQTNVQLQGVQLRCSGSVSNYPGCPTARGGGGNIKNIERLLAKPGTLSKQRLNFYNLPSILPKNPKNKIKDKKNKINIRRYRKTPAYLR